MALDNALVWGPDTVNRPALLVTKYTGVRNIPASYFFCVCRYVIIKTTFYDDDAFYEFTSWAEDNKKEMSYSDVDRIVKEVYTAEDEGRTRPATKQETMRIRLAAIVRNMQEIVEKDHQLAVGAKVTATG